MKDKIRFQAAKDEQNKIFCQKIETLVNNIKSSSPSDQEAIDRQVIEIATDNTDIIYHMGSNEGSLIYRLRQKEIKLEEKPYEIVAFAIINHILHVNRESRESIESLAEEDKKTANKTLIECLLKMNQYRANLLQEVLDSLSLDNQELYRLAEYIISKEISILLEKEQSEDNKEILTELMGLCEKRLLSKLSEQNSHNRIGSDFLLKSVKEITRSENDRSRDENEIDINFVQIIISYYSRRNINLVEDVRNPLLQIFKIDELDYIVDRRNKFELLHLQKLFQEKRKVEEEEARQKEAEERARKAAEEAEKRKAEEAERARKAAAILLQANIRRLQGSKAAEEKQKRQAAEEAERARQKEAAKAARKAVEEERARKAAEEEQKRKAAEEKQKRQAAAKQEREAKEEVKKLAQQKKRQAKQDEAMARRLAEEQKRQAAKEEARQKEAEEQARKAAKEATRQAETAEEKVESGSDELYKKLLAHVGEEEKYRKYLQIFTSEEESFIAKDGVDKYIDIKKELLIKLLSFNPRTEIRNLISKELKYIQGNLGHYIDCFCNEIKNLDLISHDMIKVESLKYEILVTKLIDFAKNEDRQTDKQKAIARYFYKYKEYLPLTGDDYKIIFEIILKYPDFFKKNTDDKIDYLKFLSQNIDTDISHDLIDLMQSFASETKEAHTKNKVYLMLLLDENGTFLTKDLFDQYIEFYKTNRDNKKVREDFLSEIKKLKEKIPAQDYIASKLLKDLSISSDAKESKLQCFMNEGDRKFFSPVFLEQLCEEILANSDEDKTLINFIKKLNAEFNKEAKYAGSKFQQVIYFFIKKNINNPEKLSQFFTKIKLERLMDKDVIDLINNPKNIPLDIITKTLKLTTNTAPLMSRALKRFNMKFANYLMRNELIKKYPQLIQDQLIQEYRTLQITEPSMFDIVLYGGNHPKLTKKDDLATVYNDATNHLLSLSKEVRNDLSLAFFRLSLELEVDLKPILDKFIEKNCEIELLHIIEMFPPESLGYLLENSDKLIFNKEFLEYAKSKIDEQKFYKALIKNYINNPTSLEQHAALVCLYKLDQDIFNECDNEIGLIDDLYGENWFDVSKFQRKYHKIIEKLKCKTLTAEDIQDIDLSMRLNNGVPLLLKLCESKNFNDQICSTIKSSLTQDILLKDIEGRNILHIAIERGNNELLRALLGDQELKGDIKVLAKELDANGNSIFSYVFNSGYTQTEILEILDILLKNKISPNITDESGFDPLYYALANQFEIDEEPNLKILEVLLTHGANPNIKDKEEKTILDKLIEQHNLGLISFFLDHSKNIEVSKYNLDTLIKYLDKENYGRLDQYYQCKPDIIKIIIVALTKDNVEVTEDHHNFFYELWQNQPDHDIQEIIKKITEKLNMKQTKQLSTVTGLIQVHECTPHPNAHAPRPNAHASPPESPRSDNQTGYLSDELEAGAPFFPNHRVPHPDADCDSPPYDAKVNYWQDKQPANNHALGTPSQPMQPAGFAAMLGANSRNAQAHNQRGS